MMDAEYMRANSGNPLWEPMKKRPTERWRITIIPDNYNKRWMHSYCRRHWRIDFHNSKINTDAWINNDAGDNLITVFGYKTHD